MLSTSIWVLAGRSCARVRLPGRRGAAPVQAVWPGSLYRTWPAGWGRRWVSRSHEIGNRVDGLGIEPQLKMHLRLVDVSGGSRIGDNLSALHSFAAGDRNTFGMSICRDIAAVVANENQIAVALQLVADIGHR